MRAWIEIGRAGLDSVLLHPLRGMVTIGALVAMLLPYLVGLGLFKGLQEQAQESVRFGADLSVTGMQFGRNVPIPVEVADRIGSLEGVTAAVPRITGRVVLGKDREAAVVVGLPADRLPQGITCVEGRMITRTGNEMVLGTELAERLRLKAGSLVPPFYHSSEGDRVMKVVGLFRSDVSVWQARLILTSLETASRIFDQRGLATEVLVSVKPGKEKAVAQAIERSIPCSDLRGGGTVRLLALSRTDVEHFLPQGLLSREGVFHLHFVLAFAIGIPVILMTSGLGLSERRREIGILKATGWQTDEILLRGLVESLVLALLSASISLILAYVWGRWLNGYGAGGLFFGGAGIAPSFRVPFRLESVLALLAYILSLAVVMTGTAYAVWRAATLSPMEAMR